VYAIDKLGMSVTETANHYQVSQTTASNIKRVFYAEEGRVEKKPNRGRKDTKLSIVQKDIIRQ